MALVQHIPVLLNEVIAGLQVKPAGVYVDGTLGGAGHAEAILNALSQEGKLIGIDRDAFALSYAKKRLERFGERFLALRGIYPEIQDLLKKNGFQKIDGILLDLGFSSFQIDEARRGFSFVNEGPLDMRMNEEEDTWTAADYVNESSEEELKEIFQKFGEERFAGRIARNITEVRSARPFQTTKDLAQVIERSVPGKFRHGRTHPATKVFQALRIAVNRELECLDQFLKQDFSYLNTGARVLIISFHSLEDRKVKWAFRGREDFKIITKKPLEASEEELVINPRARSAKLRIFEKK
ncbi:MAG: 16S rRNA (cytosine(1402)-N(4))-methyltransferase RsmH [Deltaproteobacteria bacterium]|nr:16S rRNA (cytosine(1402)-N(4))-methyltransferase RsmH [Deltaproteobacteria bacterium]